jgi:hypothetical protein
VTAAELGVGQATVAHASAGRPLGCRPPVFTTLRGGSAGNPDRPSQGPGSLAKCPAGSPSSCFWLADFLARGGGSPDEAHHSFAQTLGYANDLGLFAEEIDPKTGDALGNLPQAFTHVGLINAALSLAEREERDHHQGAAVARCGRGQDLPEACP